MNKSEELAKLLGIEPKSLCEINPLEDDEECHIGFPCYVCEANEAKYYPDFTNPINFVKLLEIMFQLNLADFGYINSNTSSFVDGYLTYVIIVITNPIDDEEKNSIISKAQATQWTY